MLMPIQNPKYQTILRKTQKNSKLQKGKRILKPKYELSGGPIFTYSLPGGTICLSAPRQLRHWR